MPDADIFPATVPCAVTTGFTLLVNDEPLVPVMLRYCLLNRFDTVRRIVGVFMKAVGAKR